MKIKTEHQIRDYLRELAYYDVSVGNPPKTPTEIIEIVERIFKELERKE